MNPFDKYDNSRKISTNNPDSAGKVQKIDYVYPSNATNGKIIFIVHVNTIGPRSWANIDAPKFADTLKPYGDVSYDAQTPGLLYLEIPSAYGIKLFVDNIPNVLGFKPTSFFNEAALDNYKSPVFSSKSLHDLAYESKAKEVDNLIRSGKARASDKDSNGDTILHIAYFKDDLKMAQTALSWGGSINAINNKGDSLVTLAINAGNKKWFNFAISNGAYKDIKDASNSNLLHQTVNAYKKHLEHSGSSTKSKEYVEIAKTLAHDKHGLAFAINDSYKAPLSTALELYPFDNGSMYKVLVNETTDVHLY